MEELYGELPNTHTIRTASGGEHRYYKVDKDDGPFSGKLATDIDIKTTGGFVVGPGSVVNGKTYEVINDVPMADLPKAYVERAKRKERPITRDISDVELDTPKAIERAKDWLKRSAPDHGTYAVAAKVKDFGISREKCLELLMEDWVEAKELGKDVEHVEFRVNNAYQYGQNPVGSRSAEAEFDPVEIDDKPAPPKKRKRLYYELLPKVELSTNSISLIDDWYDCGAMVVTYGESESGKTHVVLSQAFAIAAGQPWAGSDTRKGLVVYVAAEGGRGIKKRVVAWREKLQQPDIPFALVPCPIDLWSTPGDTKPLIKLIRAAEEECGCKAAMVVIDTLSRALAGGNENASEDMGAIVMHCDQIREATKATVHLVHHTGKSKASGARGHSSLRAATDTEIEISKGSIKATKQRDMDHPKPLRFELETIKLGVDNRGKKITTALPVISMETEFTPTALSADQDTALDALEGTLDDSDKSDIGLRHGEWFAEFCLVHGVEKTAKGIKSKFNRLVREVQDSRKEKSTWSISSGHVKKSQRGQYLRSDLVR